VKQSRRPSRPARGTSRLRKAPRSTIGRLLGDLLLVIFVAPAIVILLYRIVPPPVTPLMLIRVVEGYGLTKDWVPLSEISPNLQRAVIASEDAKFCLHRGFDWDAVDNAIERLQKKERRVLGASTISMQTSKNLFLWPGRTFVRKGSRPISRFGSKPCCRRSAFSNSI